MILKLIVVFSEATDGFYFLPISFAEKGGNVGHSGQNPSE
jgi:hypothetical protein